MYNGPPFFYETVNRHNAMCDPYTVHVTNTGLADFFRRYLIQKALSVFEWRLPKHWDRNYFLYVLYCYGYLAVVNTDKFGVIPQQCSLRGMNVFYQPYQAVIVNPLLRGILDPVIDVQCVIFKLQPDYQGILDLAVFYSDQMALAAESYGVNSINSKLAYLLLAENSKTANSLKKLYDEITAGKPAVIADNSLFKGSSSNPTYMMEQIKGTEPKQLLDLLNTISQLEIMYDRAVGIPNVSTTRRERELTDELAMNAQNSRSLASLWLDQLQDSCDKTRRMFGIDIQVDWRIKDETVDFSAGPVQSKSEAV